MAWPSRFLAVPVARLRVDPDLKPTNKASPEQLRSYVRYVPEVYERLCGDGSLMLLETSRAASASDINRELADSYHHFFSPAGRDGRIEAEFVDGTLVVTRGRHRVNTAQHEGISYVPVHVRACSDDLLTQVTAELESELAMVDPAIVDVQRRLDVQHRAVAPIRLAERAALDKGEREGMSIEIPGVPRRKSPEFEPQAKPSAPDMDRAARALGALATSKQVQSPAAARQDRITRALGDTAVQEATRDKSRTPSRKRS